MAGIPDEKLQELRDRIDKAMAKLPEHYRMLVAAHYLEGVQYEALAEALGIPLGTVKTHLHRARAALKARLAARRKEREH